MCKTLTSAAVSILAFTLVTNAVPALAAAAKKTDATAARYAAVEACTRQAQAQAPALAGDEGAQQRQRGALYIACMKKAGFRP
jgi:4'-phosphopantetheinyl transferase EntD